jgi:hypothetical protein
MFQSGRDVGVGTATLLKSSTGIATTFDCEAYANLNACLDAAEAYATTNEAGAGHAARVLLGDGVYPLAAPYEITSGITLVGIKPRLKSSCSNGDLCMAFNDGTIIDCGGQTCFTSTTGGVGGVSDINFEAIGFQNWSGAIWMAGGNNITGCNFCTIRDVIGIGSSSVNGSDQGFVFYNSQHITADNIKIANVNTGWTMISQGSNGNIPGNSEVDGLYVFTYPKSAANGNSSKPGILLETLSPASGLLNLITLKRPQVNTYGGDKTSDGILLSGVNNISIFAADVEVNAANAIHLVNSGSNYIDVSEVFGTGASTYDINVDANSRFNTVMSENPFTLVYLDPAAASRNVFYGIYSGTAFAGSMGQGVYNISGQGVVLNGSTGNLSNGNPTLGSYSNQQAQLKKTALYSPANRNWSVPATGTVAISSENAPATTTTPVLSAVSTLNTITLTENVTSSTIGAGAAGARTAVAVCQDAVGGHSFIWPSNVRGGMTVEMNPSKCSVQDFIYSSVQNSWLAMNNGVTSE